MTESSRVIAGILMLPLGVFLMCAAGLMHVYTILAESAAFERFKERAQVGVMMAMFFSFSLAFYAFAPKARRKGWLVVALFGLGLACYILAKKWLPSAA
ncbi:hypothetical protein AB8Q18_12085 [Neisseriaceae bacterium CLB008]|nr:hypothetical protein [Neisseriaceae bacterium]